MPVLGNNAVESVGEVGLLVCKYSMVMDNLWGG